ncbi:MAG: PEP-CTERM sorting domain-containing protein [Verrucomicrobiota bacterium]
MKKAILLRTFLALTITLFAAVPQSRGGDLLLAAFGGDVIVRYNSTLGTFSTFATSPGMDGPTAMVYGADGNLYVLNEFSHNVLRFNGTTGAFIDEFISSATLAAAGVPDPGDMELGADGNLYISSHFPGGGPLFTAVWKFSGTVANALLGPFATFGGVHHTHGLTFGPSGNLYLNDIDNGGPHIFNGITGAKIGTIALGSPPIFFGDLTFTPDGTLYVTVDGGGGVLRYDGVTTTALISPGAGQSYWGILAADGFLYVSNKDSGTLKKYTDTGVFVADITGGPPAFDIIAMVVPEPGTGLLLFVGLVGLGLSWRRWRKSAFRAE